MGVPPGTAPPPPVSARPGPERMRPVVPPLMVVAPKVTSSGPGAAIGAATIVSIRMPTMWSVMVLVPNTTEPSPSSPAEPRMRTP